MPIPRAISTAASGMKMIRCDSIMTQRRVLAISPGVGTKSGNVLPCLFQRRMVMVGMIEISPTRMNNPTLTWNTGLWT